MLLLSILVCFSSLLQASLSTPILATKPKPVDLAFTCMAVFDAKETDFKLDSVPVILLHGMTLNKETWHGILELIALDTKKKVCVADLRNHGQSPWNDKEYDVIAMTEDVKHLMDRINAPKAILLGHSLGGKIGVHLALTYPERVEKLIVEDMRPNGQTEDSLKGAESFARLLIDLEKYIPQGVTEREAKEEFLKIMKESLAKINVTYEIDDLTYIPVKCSDGKCKLSVNPVILEVVARNIFELLNESSGRFDGPALFIYGTESGLRVNEDEKNIKKLFPAAKLVGVEGADHVVHTSKKFMREVIKFINSK
ncbi:protein ABHD11-like [Argiope bruennichi]|uniref:sn-1-specific diacylglycerol lipase ABHD11 n=1 Tax=Argiope bruennichi TaxID=94029 RepID=A0A8T0G145_ARGBR|nr:protein ABHD11-like [Argiope bruennichi]KAF8796931.1 Protein ABHD11 like protein [Argiope bruennichi]